MTEIEVDASELKSEESKIIEQLADFLKDKTGAEVATESKTVKVNGEGEAVTKKYLRVTIKKFLHKHGLTDSFRVISDEENALKVKERKIREED